MGRNLPGAFLVAFLSSSIVFAQGVDTTQRATDWEEINFEFNQSVIVDGFPSMLRLADLLKQHSDYKVNITGHADQIGSARYNMRLSQKRADAVSQFLQKYGATAAQITAKGDGKSNLEANGRGVNQRFLNRRVTITVTAPDGTQIGDGTVTSAILDFIKTANGQLSKIDAIQGQIRDLENQLKTLQGDTGTIKQTTSAIQESTTAIKQDTGAIHNDTQDLVKRPSPLTAEQTTEIARAEATNAADYALTQSALRNRKYSLIGFNGGPTFGNGSIYGTGKQGNYSAEVYAHGLIPFGNGKTPEQPGTHGIQIDGDWLYFHKNDHRADGRNEGLFDLGLVNRFNRVQVGAFAQFDYVSFNAYRGGTMLGNGVATVDYVMPRGIVGVFGSKGFRDYASLGTSMGSGTTFPAYLRLADQVGLHMAFSVGKHFSVEGSGAYVKRLTRGLDPEPAGTLKVSYDISDHLSVYVAGDHNPTFQNIRFGDRAVIGLEFGNWLRPNKYHDTEGVVPVSVPRPHYEIVGR